VYVSLEAFLATYNPIYLLIVFSQTQLVIFFLIRGSAKDISTSPFDYTVSILGTFLVLLYKPAYQAFTPITLIGNILVYIAVCIEVWGVWSLNTSFGIVAANRGVKKGGLYMFMRHPIYLGSMFLYIGYACTNFTAFNLGILLIALVCQIVRIQMEEKLLRHSEEYIEYSKRVKYRLIPGLY
jgi:protein-S-isoprenylcysteine O-methyltransferase Ste14